MLKKKPQGKAAAGANKPFDGITLSWNASQRHQPLIVTPLLILTNTLFILKCFIWSFLQRDTQALTKCTYNHLSLHQWNPLSQDLVLCLRPAGGGQALCSNSIDPFPASHFISRKLTCQPPPIIFHSIVLHSHCSNRIHVIFQLLYGQLELMQWLSSPSPIWAHMTPYVHVLHYVHKEKRFFCPQHKEITTHISLYNPVLWNW